jgi:hypothetical protein
LGAVLAGLVLMLLATCAGACMYLVGFALATLKIF